MVSLSLARRFGSLINNDNDKKDCGVANGAPEKPSSSLLPVRFQGQIKSLLVLLLVVLAVATTQMELGHVVKDFGSSISRELPTAATTLSTALQKQEHNPQQTQEMTASSTNHSDPNPKMTLVKSSATSSDSAESSVNTNATIDASAEITKGEQQQQQQPQQQQQQQPPQAPNLRGTGESLESSAVDPPRRNDPSLAERQASIHNQCNVALSSIDNNDTIKELQARLLEDFSKVFDMPAEPKGPRNITEDPVQPCMYTFLDLGANIGDSFGKFIDAGFPNSCPALDKKDHQVHFQLDTGKMEMNGRNHLTDHSRAMLKLVNRTTEQYCYVGVEGNPVFTERLQLLEARMRETVPSPIAAAHFYTETVGTSVDGPTTLFLDTKTVAKNFWGSSLFATHPDVRKSSVQGQPVGAPVMGLTLSTLVKRAVKKEPGAHVFIKMDIEGGEYPVMNAAIDTLCEYSLAGVRVDLLIEFHSAGFLGANDTQFFTYQNATRYKYKDCNINTGALSGKARR